MARKQPKLQIRGKAPTMAEVIMDLNIPMTRVKNLLTLLFTAEAAEEKYKRLAKEVKKLRQKRSKKRK